MSLSLDAMASSGLGEAVDSRQIFERLAWRRVLWIAAGACFLALTCLVAVSIGTKSLSLAETAQILLGGLLPDGSLGDVTTLDEKIVWQLRMPRVVMAVVAGAGLAVTGVMMQGITRNPLVSPFTVGLSPAAAFGAARWSGLRMPGARRCRIVRFIPAT